jgi:hypothetical protein
MKATRLRSSREPASPWQLRIELLDVKPTVWRRLVVPSNIRLSTLGRCGGSFNPARFDLQVVSR